MVVNQELRNRAFARKFRKGPEKALLNSWLWKEHRNDMQWRNVRLGPLPTKEMARAFMVLLRFADAIFIKDGIVNIVEAKVRPKPDAIGQLEFYQGLFRETPEFQQFANFPIQLIMLTSRIDLAMQDFATGKNIKTVVFTENDVNSVRRELLLPIIKLEEI